MLTSRFLRCLLGVAVIGVGAVRVSAAVLFSDNFNTNTSGSWTTNVAPAANALTQQATFAYNYQGMGIPAAPGSADTLGLRLRSNIPIVGGEEVTTRPGGVISGLSLSPTGKNFGTNYQLSFYAWANFCGAPNASGLADNGASEGGTFNVMFAVGTAGTVPLVVGNTGLASGGAMDGVGFATTGDGGITNDYRAYPASGLIAPAASGVYAAGSTANTNAFYTALFPAQSAPAVQQEISVDEYPFDAFNTQAGSTQPGSFGFAWQKVVITKSNNIVTWDINDTRIATVDASALALGGSNIALGMSDVNATTARHPLLVFTLIENLVVTDLPSNLQGDYSDNGFVDAADYTVWRDHLGEATEASLLDRGDGLNGVDEGDYNLWRNNFGNGAGAAAIASAPIPEPSSWLLLALGASCCCRPARKVRNIASRRCRFFQAIVN